MEELVEASVKFIEFDSGRAHEMERPMWEMLLSVGSHGSGTEARSLPCSPLPVQPRRNRLLRVRRAARPTLPKVKLEKTAERRLKRYTDPCSGPSSGSRAT